MKQRPTLLRLIVAGCLVAVILGILIFSPRPIRLWGAVLIVIAVGGLCGLGLTRRSST